MVSEGARLQKVMRTIVFWRGYYLLWFPHLSTT